MPFSAGDSSLEKVLPLKGGAIYYKEYCPGMALLSQFLVQELSCYEEYKCMGAGELLLAMGNLRKNYEAVCNYRELHTTVYMCIRVGVKFFLIFV